MTSEYVKVICKVQFNKPVGLFTQHYQRFHRWTRQSPSRARAARTRKETETAKRERKARYGGAEVFVGDRCRDRGAEGERESSEEPEFEIRGERWGGRVEAVRSCSVPRCLPTSSRFHGYALTAGAEENKSYCVTEYKTKYYKGVIITSPFWHVSPTSISIQAKNEAAICWRSSSFAT